MHSLVSIFKRFGFQKLFWQKFCHKKVGQVEPFLSFKFALFLVCLKPIVLSYRHFCTKSAQRDKHTALMVCWIIQDISFSRVFSYITRIRKDNFVDSHNVPIWKTWINSSTAGDHVPAAVKKTTLVPRVFFWKRNLYLFHNTVVRKHIQIQ